MEKSTNTAPGLLKILGPGLIWAMAAIGQTHIILATYSGAKFGFSLLWVVVLAHILTYPVFEYGPRYAVASGESLIDAYTKLPGLGKPLLYFFGFLLLTVPFLVTASVLSVTASVLHAAWQDVSFAWWCLIITFGTGGIAIAGRYKGLEVLCLVMSAILLVATVAAFCQRPPNVADMIGGAVNPAIPVGSMVTLVALMRMPTDPATSIMHSVWAVNKRDDWIAGEGLQTGLKRSLLDLRIGFGFSLVIAVIFVSLGATVLHPRGVDLEGVDLAMKLSGIYTETVGAWTFPLFIGVAFIALWGSYYTSVDGVPRMVERLWVSAKGKNKAAGAPGLRTGYMIAMLIGGLLFATIVGKPVALVLIAVSAGLIAYPMIYMLNIYAVTRLIDKEFRPSRLNLAVAYLGVVYAIVGVTLLVLVRIFNFWN